MASRALSDPELDGVRRAILEVQAAQERARGAIQRASDAGHSQRAIAQYAGVSHTTIYRILRGGG